MPLHDVGYRQWQGAKSSRFTRWWIVAKTGVRLAFRSTWLSRTLILACVPALVIGFGLFAYEQSINDYNMRRLVKAWVTSSQAGSELAEQVMRDPAGARHDVWAAMMLLFFRYPQAIFMLLVVALVAPRLISSDIRNRGYLLYFSRPLKPPGYMFGKALVISFFIAMLTTAPAFLLYFVGLSLSPDISAFYSTWDLPFRVLGASLVLMIPVSSIALACSALTSETRYAVFAWFAFWVVGWVSYAVMMVAESALPLEQQGKFVNWEIISPFHVLGSVQQYVFGLYPDDRSIIPFVVVLTVVTCSCLWFVHWQLRRRMRG